MDEEFFNIYKDNWDKKRYNELDQALRPELVEKAKGLLAENKSVILDYGFWKKVDRDKYKEIFKDLADIQVIYFDVPKETRLERVLSTRDKANNHNLNEEALEIFEKIFEIPRAEELGV